MATTNTTAAYQALHHQAPALVKPPSSAPIQTYSLQRYVWRAFLSIVGPILLLAFYTFICFYYLERAPINNIVHSVGFDARGTNYAWFVLSIFALDWGRTVLANAEAAAVMKPILAPHTAMQLMWHADGKWANILWWYRGLRSAAQALFRRRKTTVRPKPNPGRLFWLLSATTFLLFVGIPLSGLTMELTTVSAPSRTPAWIRGPTLRTFNYRGILQLPEIVRGRWLSGAATTPTDATIFHAPLGTLNASTQYYDDKILDPSTQWVQTFLPPSVTQTVSGSVWGLESNVSCRPVGVDELKLIKVIGWNKYQAWINDPSVRYEPIGEPSGAALVLNETGFVLDDHSLYSVIMGADGTWYGDTPYDDLSNHDYLTYDSLVNHAPGNGPTSALFELYLWQAFVAGSLPPDPTMQSLLRDPPLYVRTKRLDFPYSTYGYFGNNLFKGGPVDFAGFGVQCRVNSQLGTASLDAATRTYSDFVRNVKAVGFGGDNDVYPPQIQAIRALSHFQPQIYVLYPYLSSEPDSTWLTLHSATNVEPYFNKVCGKTGTLDVCDQSRIVTYPGLTPKNVTLGLYKLLGESMIAMMGPGSQEPWQGDLHVLKQIRWLTRGKVPWQLCFALLTFWALITVFISIITLFTKRWAPAMGAFDFFKFGAEYTDYVKRFTSMEFEECEAL